MAESWILRRVPVFVRERPGVKYFGAGRRKGSVYTFCIIFYFFTADYFWSNSSQKYVHVSLNDSNGQEQLKFIYMYIYMVSMIDTFFLYQN